MKKILVLFAMVSLVIPISVSAQSTLALQEKCAEGAKKIVSETGGCDPAKPSKDKDFMMQCEYKCHYNKKLDKCFIRFDLTTVWWDSAPKQLKRRTEEAVQLVDVFEHRMIAHYDNGLLSINEVEGTKCNSRAEFEALIKPLMEE